jgi:hypothetical protein
MALSDVGKTVQRHIKVGSKASDYEALGDAVVIYLKDGELVQLE